MVDSSPLHFDAAMANREARRCGTGTSSGAARSRGTAVPLDIDAQCVRRCPEGSLLLPLTHPPAIQIERPDICEQRFKGSRRSPRVVAVPKCRCSRKGIAPSKHTGRLSCLTLQHPTKRLLPFSIAESAPVQLLRKHPLFARVGHCVRSCW